MFAEAFRACAFVPPAEEDLSEEEEEIRLELRASSEKRRGWGGRAEAEGASSFAGRRAA